MDDRVDGKVALVTGASRGVGKGVALALGEAGAIVYITGRTVSGEQPTTTLEGTLDATAAEVRARGGECVAVRCDHRDDDAVRNVLSRIQSERGRLDVLVNNVWGGYEPLHAGRFDRVPGAFLGAAARVLGRHVRRWSPHPLRVELRSQFRSCSNTAV